MGLLLILRALTLAAHLALAGALLVVVLDRKTVLPSSVRTAWVAIAVTRVTIAVDNALLEGFALAKAIGTYGSLLASVHLPLYLLLYWLNALLYAVLPAVLVIVCAERRQERWPFGALAGFAVLLGGLAVARGALSDWNELLTWTQSLAFVGIAGYLGFCSMALLGRLPRVDAYLLGFVAIQGLFELLIPIQELFFQSAGRGSAAELWTLLQFLQCASTLAQLVVVLALHNALKEGRGLRRATVPI